MCLIDTLFTTSHLSQNHTVFILIQRKPQGEGYGFRFFFRGYYSEDSDLLQHGHSDVNVIEEEEEEERGSTKEEIAEKDQRPGERLTVAIPSA